MSTIITFEGIEGSGKTTLIQALRDHFAAQGLSVWLTQEPFLLEGSRRGRIHPDPFTAMLQLIIDRRAHCAAMLGNPAFDLILIDRFEYSTEAYQGYGDGVDRDLINTLNDIATEGIDVSLRIWLDVPVEIAIIRQINRGDTVTDADEARLRRVHAGYAELTEEGWMWPIDATQPPDDVLREAIALIEEIL